MTENPYNGKWEQRWHPLRREWIVYSAHRDQRPWDGATESDPSTMPAHDPACYLCPGNQRIHGDKNPAYEDVFVFANDHPVVGVDAPEINPDYASLYQKERAHGVSRVICYDPRHDVSVSDLSLESAGKIITTWREQQRELADLDFIQFILFFENKGAICGTSSPHPHGQLYATNFVFKHVDQELEALKTERNLFEKIIENEINRDVRIVAENEYAVAFVPFFARYAYEIWVFPKNRHATLATLDDQESMGLGEVYREVSRRYDLLFGMSLPYVMSVYQAPVDGGDYRHYHFHLVFLPPLRQPGLQKFPAGPEIGGGNFMCDSIPEEKAEELRNINPDDYE